MKIKVNGKITDVEGVLSVGGLMAARGFKPGEVIVQLNGDIVDKSEWDSILLKENDEMEILRFVGGG